MLQIDRVEVTEFEPYSKKKYSDNFGGNPNPLKLVCHCVAYFTNGTSLKLILKLTESGVSDARVKEKAITTLKSTGLLS
jgi:hypothetical protein